MEKQRSMEQIGSAETRQELRQAEIEIVKGPEHVQAFVEAAVHYLGMGFHPDTPFSEYVDEAYVPIFSAEEVRLYDDAMALAFDTLPDLYEIVIAAAPKTYVLHLTEGGTKTVFAYTENEAASGHMVSKVEEVS